ncbi:MAG: AAA domain-containing protein [Methanococci archaeon]|nr:AAA domain-containing protein [Methanococci archaeon]
MCILTIWEVLKNDYLNFENVNFYKVSLGEKGREEDKEIFDYCIKNNMICVGFNDDTDYTKYSYDIDKIDEKEIEKRRNEIYKTIDEKGVEVNPSHKSSIRYIVLEMKKGDIVLVSDGTTKIKAIGVITGDYEYKKDSPLKDFNMYQFRKVKWLWIAKNEDEYIDVSKIQKVKRSFGESTIHRLDKNTLNIEFLREFIINNLPYDDIKKIVIQKLKEHKKSKNVFKSDNFKNAPKYYLIIDEINRGNISNILGELITLLEKDKRLTGKNQIIATLPYSKEPFAVPPNLYIIGTMNTADRSIALLDIALRRRFGFIEIEPDYEMLKDKNIGGINLAELLKALNDKIVISKDKDHRIGHSYFLNVNDKNDLWFVWYYEIIPLLEEYFYGDFEGLKQVLGDKFVDTNNYEIKKLEGDEFINALNAIIQNNQNIGEGNE